MLMKHALKTFAQHVTVSAGSMLPQTSGTDTLTQGNNPHREEKSNTLTVTSRMQRSKT